METNQFEQFLRPLIEGIVLNPNIELFIRRSDGGVLASVIVDEADQRLIIGAQGGNVMALQRIFREWCRNVYQIDGKLAVLEPTGPKGPIKNISTKPDPGTYLSIHADWLIGELFGGCEFKTEVEPGKEGDLNLVLQVDAELDPEMLAALTRYFRAVGKNHGITLQIYIRRFAKS